MNTPALAGLAIGRYASRDTLRRYQTSRLRALVEHAARTVPFYRRRFDAAGVRAGNIQSLDDLQRLPLTLKSELRDAPESDAISSRCDPGRLVRYGTGGSTGQPMAVRMTRAEDYLQRITRLQAMFALGLRPTDTRAAVLFSRAPDRRSLIERFGLMRYHTVHALRPPAAIIGDLRRLRPHVIRGYASVLSDLAGRLSDDDRRHIRPRFLTTDSETLTALARARIEEGFRAPVFDVYDCFECNVIARQCARGDAYHVIDHAVIAEVLVDGRPAAPGEAGEIAITVLHSYAAPLIRYMPGDIAVRGPATCPCGAPASCLAEIQGRVHDRLQLPDGRRVHPKILAAWIYPLCPVLQRYQMVQEATDRVVVRLQPAANVSLASEAVETMRRGIARDLGAAVRVDVSIVDDIPSQANGKFQPYRSALTA
jgi:phenylacetate-CoA ligase